MLERLHVVCEREKINVFNKFLKMLFSLFINFESSLVAIYFQKIFFQE